MLITRPLSRGKPKSGVSAQDQHSYQIYTTAGRHPYGAITELRHGLEARILFQVGLEAFSGSSELWSTASGLWALSDACEDGLYILVSTPSESMVFRIWDDEVEMCVDSEFITDQPTIASASTEDGRILQISQRNIALFTPEVGGLVRSKLLSTSNSSDERHILAAMDLDNGRFATVTRGRDHLTLELKSLEGLFKVADLDGAKTMLDLRAEPTALTVAKVFDAVCIILGDSAGTLHIYHFDRHTLGRASVHQLPAASQSNPSICESMTVLSSDSGEDFILLCGLRNGEVRGLNFTLEDKGEVPPLIVSSG